MSPKNVLIKVSWDAVWNFSKRKTRMKVAASDFIKFTPYMRRYVTALKLCLVEEICEASPTDYD